MENLKNTISKTETLKNNIKIIFNQIKQSIIRGGGSDFKELAQTPKRIEDLIKQYNKVAIGDIKQSCMLSMNQSKNLVVNTNFECKYVFFKIHGASMMGGANPNEIAFLSGTETGIQIILKDARYKIEKVNSSTFKLIGWNSSQSTSIFIDSYIAIG